MHFRAELCSRIFSGLWTDSNQQSIGKLTVDKVNLLSLYISSNIFYNIISSGAIIIWRNLDMSGLRIGEKIKAKRRERDLTQEELANILGVSKAAVSKWETDESYPDITLLTQIPKHLKYLRKYGIMR